MQPLMYGKKKLSGAKCSIATPQKLCGKKTIILATAIVRCQTLEIHYSVIASHSSIGLRASLKS